MVARRVHKNSLGFTLAELLIVVAIVLVLVAVAVPVFTGVTKSAEEATCEANRRSAKVVLATTYLLDTSVKPTQSMLDECVAGLEASNSGQALCPASGNYTLAGNVEAGSIIVKCSVHGLSEDDEMYQWIVDTFPDTSWNDYFAYKDDQAIRDKYATDKGLTSWPVVKGTDANGNQKDYYLQFKSYSNKASCVFLYAGYNSDPHQKDWTARYVCDTKGLLGEGSKGQWYQVPEKSNVSMYKDAPEEKLIALLQSGTKVDLVNGEFKPAS